MLAAEPTPLHNAFGDVPALTLADVGPTPGPCDASTPGGPPVPTPAPEADLSEATEGCTGPNTPVNDDVTSSDDVPMPERDDGVELDYEEDDEL